MTYIMWWYQPSFLYFFPLLICILVILCHQDDAQFLLDSYLLYHFHHLSHISQNIAHIYVNFPQVWIFQCSMWNRPLMEHHNTHPHVKSSWPSICVLQLGELSYAASHIYHVNTCISFQIDVDLCVTCSIEIPPRLSYKSFYHPLVSCALHTNHTAGITCLIYLHMTLLELHKLRMGHDKVIGLKLIPYCDH